MNRSSEDQGSSRSSEDQGSNRSREDQELERGREDPGLDLTWIPPPLTPDQVTIVTIFFIKNVLLTFFWSKQKYVAFDTDGINFGNFLDLLENVEDYQYLLRKRSNLHHQISF